MYNQGTSTVRLHKDSNKINLDRGVRQGDTVSHQLFNAALGGIFRRLDWDRKGININGYLSHLRFADDIVLLKNNAEELEKMLNDLNKESNNIGLRINMKKTKVMFNSYAKVKQINDIIIETTDRYIYISRTTCKNRLQPFKRS